MAISITVNGKRRSTEAASDTPLLYVLRNELELRGPKFGCGLSQCGACSVLVDGKEIRSCVTPVAAVEGRKVTTLEGLPAWFAQEKQLATVPELHPLQQAWIDVDVAQCGYCQGGQIMNAAALLNEKPKPTDADIHAAMTGNMCRCACYTRIRTAIRTAAKGGTNAG
jgi:isoquinoline 1-oxidoreductase subunit alpha